MRPSLPPRRPSYSDDLAPSEGHRITDASRSPSPNLSHAAALPGFVLPADEGRGSLLRTARATVHALSELDRSLVVAQAYELGVRSLPFLCLVLAFVGGIIVYQGGLQAMRIVPDTSGIGPTYLELLVRDLAASLTGLMLATRVGAGIAAELGSMKVTDQLDALRLCQADPVVYLVAPRVVACVLVAPVVTFIAGSVALASGTLVGHFAFEIHPGTFLDPRFVSVEALLTGLVKSLTFGLAVPLVSAHAGLYTSGGSQGVGDATTRAVVGSSLAVIMLGFFIGVVARVLFS